MRIIVFGGSGFIGNSFLKLPEVLKHEIILVTRNPRNIKKFADRGIQAVVWDYQSNNILKPYFQGNYAVINFAGENIGKFWFSSQRKKILNSRRYISRLISEIINTSVLKPAVMIQSSAAGFYGSRGDLEITEKTSKGKGFLSDVAAITEGSINFNSEKTRLIFIRSGIVLGKGGGFLKRIFIPFKLYLGGHFGSGKQWMPWIHRQDEVRAIAFLLEHPNAEGAYNLSAPNPVRMKDFGKIFGKILYRPSWLHIPAFLLKLLLGDFARELLLVSQKMKPTRLIEAGFQFEHPDLEEALREIYD